MFTFIVGAIKLVCSDVGGLTEEVYTAGLQVKVTTSNPVSEVVIQPELEDATPFLSLSPASGSHTHIWEFVLLCGRKFPC